MKMRYFIGIACIAAIGVGVYYYFSRKSNVKDEDCSDERELISASESNGSDYDIEEATQELKQEKSNIVDSIKIRHEEAAEVVRKSLNNIISEEAVVETENTEALNEMLSDLDKLME